MNIKTFAISSALFSYYEKDINVDLVNSTNEIILLVVSELDKLLRDNKLLMLSEKLNDCKFHVHDFTLEEVKDSVSDRKYYICDHCG